MNSPAPHPAYSCGVFEYGESNEAHSRIGTAVGNASVPASRPPQYICCSSPRAFTPNTYVTFPPSRRNSFVLMSNLAVEDCATTGKRPAGSMAAHSRARAEKVFNIEGFLPSKSTSSYYFTASDILNASPHSEVSVHGLAHCLSACHPHA